MRFRVRLANPFRYLKRRLVRLKLDVPKLVDASPTLIDHPAVGVIDAISAHVPDAFLDDLELRAARDHHVARLTSPSQGGSRPGFYGL
jgi:hypothetical protein